ncbi:GNAT family N-acetyltransferase [Actinokineospora diospyrosa]|uniref:Acetyltransferase n=1 Tax=Actinokineospora diospyrosa TaxID=103728 RepID=A0ABT1IAN9_9PSEU|nr:GNAT family N-acetyltransferase [Actinokineospora diospyrosa]MCP2269684.1 putative acetyltransferase [Actinokineospora diospyrosa]
MNTYTVRSLTPDELTTVPRLVASAFLADYAEEEIAAKDGALNADSTSLGAFVGDRQVGAVRVQERGVRVPGGDLVMFSGLTSVAVAPDYRRRGVLTALMRPVLARDSLAVSALWASESAIYGRFGYGVATESTQHTLPTKSAFRPGVTADPSAVRELPRDKAMPVIKTLYERYAEKQVGALTRIEGNWAYHYYDTEATRHGQTPYRFAVHPDGYAAYRGKPEWTDNGPRGTVHVHELVANTPEAYTSLWRYLLDIDLAATIEYEGSGDDPLVQLLPDTRTALRKRFHGLHIRLTDVAAALPLRGYQAPVDVVVEVVDSFCPWNAGRWHLVAADGRMTVAKTDSAADLTLDVRDLGAAYMGGTRLSTLAAAGLIAEHTTGAVAGLSHAMQAEREPACREVF